MSLIKNRIFKNAKAIEVVHYQNLFDNGHINATKLEKPHVKISDILFCNCLPFSYSNYYIQYLCRGYVFLGYEA